MKTFLLLFGLAGAAGLMHAAPLSYTFNFAGGSPNPTGSFDYDSSTNTFSNVMLTWDGVQQDPSDWNSLFNQSGGDFCGVAAPDALFEGLTQGACGGVTWNAANHSEPYGMESFSLTFTFDGNSGWNDYTLPAVSSAPLITTSGTVSAADVPEPGSVGLCFAGAALLVWKRRRREKTHVTVRR